MKVSVNFKKTIENFLQKSLSIYISYNEKIKKIIQEIEGSQLQNNIFQVSEQNKNLRKQVSFISEGSSSSDNINDSKNFINHEINKYSCKYFY